MFDYLEHIDQQLTLLINSWNHPVLDEIMWVISARLTWIPLYLIALFVIYKKYDWKITLRFLSFVILTVIIANYLSVVALKEIIQRYRPTHNLLLSSKIHVYQLDQMNEYRGGLYGFVSSHATNFFVLVSSFYLFFKKELKALFWCFSLAAILVIYSRIYLGVHYVSDVIGGAIFGSIVSLIMYFIYTKLNTSLKKPSNTIS